MCRPRSRPIAPIIVAESAATARPSTGMFQTLSAGKIGQAGAPGTVGAPPGGVTGVGVGVGAVSPADGSTPCVDPFPPCTRLHLSSHRDPCRRPAGSCRCVARSCSRGRRGPGSRDRPAGRHRPCRHGAVTCPPGTRRRSAGRRRRCPHGRRGYRRDQCQHGVGSYARRIPGGSSGRRGRDPRAHRGYRRDPCRHGTGWSANTSAPMCWVGRRDRCRSRRGSPPASAGRKGGGRPAGQDLHDEVGGRSMPGIVRADSSSGNASVVPAAGPRGPVPVDNASPV